MDKTLTVKAKKQQPKNKKQQLPLKVVYITNPIKFNATASEFRALVQELTGQDADSSRLEAAGQEEENVAAAAAEQGINYVDAAAQKGSDLSTTSGSYEDDGCCSPEMIDNFQGFAASSLWHGDNEVRAHVFKSLGAM
ncbi:sigma factor binding protein 1 [Perilla frutescens var. frutescens]|nr:sigma factor binding protein 1 [Perilla frutescens var. frutescens]